MSGKASEPLLAVDDLSVEFRTRSGTVYALEHVSFFLDRGETLALVGESGSGKSVTAFAIMGILEQAARITSGRILFDGSDLLHQPENRCQEIRRRNVSMIFQNPRTALNPIQRVGKQISDVIMRHAGLSRIQAFERTIELLTKVKIPAAESRSRAYPFELSGGMCQRIMIAMALSCTPALLIADEPTTGLDVTTQLAIMKLINELATEQQMATILITHDLALAAEHAERIAVMHAGHIIEVAPTEDILKRPRHPYTQSLIAATLGPAASLDSLSASPGQLPDLRRANLPPCRYSERCARYDAACDAPLSSRRYSECHVVSCHHPL